MIVLDILLREITCAIWDLRSADVFSPCENKHFPRKRPVDCYLFFFVHSVAFLSDKSLLYIMYLVVLYGASRLDEQRGAPTCCACTQCVVQRRGWRTRCAPA